MDGGCIWIVQAVLRNTVPKNTIPLIIQEITGLVLRIIAAGFLVSRGIEILLDKRISGHMQVFGISFHIFCRDGSAIVLAAVPASAAAMNETDNSCFPLSLRRIAPVKV